MCGADQGIGWSRTIPHMGAVVNGGSFGPRCRPRASLPALPVVPGRASRAGSCQSCRVGWLGRRLGGAERLAVRLND